MNQKCNAIGTKKFDHLYRGFPSKAARNVPMVEEDLAIGLDADV